MRNNQRRGGLERKCPTCMFDSARDLKERGIALVTKGCLKLIGALNPSKDRVLARELHELGDVYDPMGETYAGLCAALNVARLRGEHYPVCRFSRIRGTPCSCWKAEMEEAAKGR